MNVLLILVLLIGGLLLGLHLWTRRLARQGLELVPQLGKVIPVDGGSIHYVEAGDPARQTIVLIHGLSGQLQHYTYALMDLLAEEYHVIAVDRPGCGYSTRESAELGTLPEQARMIHQFLQIKGVSDAVLVGHSLGGAVSLAMALDYPKDVSALALLCPLTHKVPNTPAAFKALEIRTGWLRNLIGNTIAVPMARKTAPQVLADVFAPENVPDDFIYKAGGALGLRPSAYITASQDVVGADLSIQHQADRYNDLTVPGAILFGAEDKILSPRQHGEPMRQFGIAVEELEGRGHMIPITAPAECAAFIRNVANAHQIPQETAGSQ